MANCVLKLHIISQLFVPNRDELSHCYNISWTKNGARIMYRTQYNSKNKDSQGPLTIKPTRNLEPSAIVDSDNNSVADITSKERTLYMAKDQFLEIK